MNTSFFLNCPALFFVKVTEKIALLSCIALFAGCQSSPPPQIREMPPRIETPVQAEPGEIDPSAPHQANEASETREDASSAQPEYIAPAPQNGARGEDRGSKGIRYQLNGEPILLEDLQSGEIPENSTITIMAERHVPYSLVTDALLKIHEMGYLVNFGVEEGPTESEAIDETEPGAIPEAEAAE